MALYLPPRRHINHLHAKIGKIATNPHPIAARSGKDGLAPKETAPAPRGTSDDPPPSAVRPRRLALRGQDQGGARKTLERIGYVQIDTISGAPRHKR